MMSPSQKKRYKMHPYDKVLTPTILSYIKEGVKHSAASTAMIDMCIASPSPGGMLASLLRAYGLGDYLKDIVEQVLPTPELYDPLEDKDSLDVELTDKEILEAYTRTMDRYAILGTKECIADSYKIGFHCGLLFGMMISDFDIDNVPKKDLGLYVKDVFRADYMTKAGIIQDELKLVIQRVVESLRTASRLYKDKKEQDNT